MNSLYCQLYISSREGWHAARQTERPRCTRSTALLGEDTSLWLCAATRKGRQDIGVPPLPLLFSKFVFPLSLQPSP